MTPRADRLITARLTLRRAEPGDLPAFCAMLSDAETMRYWSTLPHTSVAQTQAWFDQTLAADPAESDDFVIERAGEVIGKVGIWILPEIGIVIRREHWGRGYAREALAAFLAYAAARGIAFVTADVDPLNTASLTVLGQVGFVETGRATATFTLGDRVCDSVYLRRDLAQRAPG